MYATKTKRGRPVLPKRKPKKPGERTPPSGLGRRLKRRMQRKLTSLEIRMVLLGQQLPGSPNKRAKKAATQAMRLRRAARYIVGLLVRATGCAAAPLVAKQTLDRYHQGLAERGAQAIYFPKHLTTVPNKFFEKAGAV